MESSPAVPATPTTAPLPPASATSEEGSEACLTLCIACQQLGARSETFIRTHIERLPMRIRVLVGKPPHTDVDSGFLYRKRMARKIMESVLGSVWEFDERRYQEQAMARYFRRNAIDVVLAEYGVTGIEVMRSCRRAGVPLVVHFHGSDAFLHRTLAENRVRYQELFRHAAAVVAVSRDMQGQLVRLGAPREKVHRIPYWVDAARFRGADPAHASPQFVAVGRFVEKKAPHLTLLAFAQARRVVPQIRLTMIGDGPLLGACHHLAAAYGVADAVQLAGAQDHEVVLQRLLAARAFVQHSVGARNGDCEGTPVAVLEAQASGLPVIATRHMGIQDVVVHQQTGVLVGEQDVGGMAEAMVYLAQNPVTAARWGQAGRRRVLTVFSETHTLGRLASLIREQVPASGRAGHNGSMKRAKSEPRIPGIERSL